MTRKKSKRASSVSLPPGTLVYTGETRDEKVKITVIDYDEKNIQEEEVVDIKQCLAFKDQPTVTWINIDGIHNLDIIENIGSCYDIHPLALEDILNITQRPKMEDFGNYMFIVLKMLYIEGPDHEVQVEQVSFILGENYVISFQEHEGDVFEPVRQRIRTAKGRIRKMGADYLAYALIDAVVDNYFVMLETLGEDVEDLEETLIADPDPYKLQQLRRLKREMINLRKAVWPLREVTSNLERLGGKLFRKTTLIYLRDVYDHTIQVIDSIESYRDILSSLLDLYLSSVSNRMNEVMKVLTIIATIFIPITFIAGVYGMNFEWMPELGWKWSYPIVWGVIIVVAVVMLIFFRKRKWL